MGGERLIRLAPSAAVKERRLRRSQGRRLRPGPGLRQAVLEAQAMGSLELAGLTASPEAVAALASRAGGGRSGRPLHGRRAARLAARRSRAAPPPSGARTGRASRARRPLRPHSSRAACQTLEHWLAAESARELAPGRRGRAGAGAGDRDPPLRRRQRPCRAAGRLARGRARGRPPSGPDAGRRPAAGGSAPGAAFQLHTEPLARLLDEASERALDAMLTALTR